MRIMHTKIQSNFLERIRNNLSFTFLIKNKTGETKSQSDKNKKLRYHDNFVTVKRSRFAIKYS